MQFKQKEDFDGKLKTFEAEWLVANNNVSEKEFDLVSLQTERVKLSPRAVEQGWSAQLDRDVKQHRIWVTENKANALFKVAVHLREMRARKEKLDFRFQDLMEDRKRLEDRWGAERADMWDRENIKRFANQQYETAKKAAHEKRKWAVTYATDTGKVDLRRRPGRPLDPAEFPHSTSRSLTIAHGDITSLTKPEVPSDPFAFVNAARDARIRLEHALASRMIEYDNTFGNAFGGASFASSSFVPAAVGAAAPVPMLPAPQTDIAPPNARSSGGGGGGTGGRGGGGGGLPLLADGTMGGTAASEPYKDRPPASGRVSPSLLAAVAHANDSGRAPSGTGVLSLVGTQQPQSQTQNAGKRPGQQAQEEDQQQRQLVPGEFRPEERPDLREGYVYGSGKAITSVFGVVPEGARGKVMTVGRYFGEELGFSISGDASSLDAQGGKKKGMTGLKAKPLHERVWETSISRYAGVGPTLESADPRARPRTEAAEHVEAARAAYATMIMQNLVEDVEHTSQIEDEDLLQADEGMGDSASVAPSTARTTKTGAAPVATGRFSQLTTSKQPGSSPQTAKSSAKEQALAIVQSTAPANNDGVMQERRIPAYIEAAKNAAAQQASSELSADMKRTVQTLEIQKAEAAALATLPPGLMGARRAEASIAIATSKLKGTIGTTAVRTVQLDTAEDRKIEQMGYDASSGRITQLVQQISAVSGQAELMQYGSLSKPLFDGMTTLMMNLTAADGTAAAMSRVAETKERKEAERQKKMNDARAARAAGKANPINLARAASMDETAFAKLAATSANGSGSASLSSSSKTGSASGTVLNATALSLMQTEQLNTTMFGAPPEAEAAAATMRKTQQRLRQQAQSHQAVLHVSRAVNAAEAAATATARDAAATLRAQKPRAQDIWAQEAPPPAPAASAPSANDQASSSFPWSLLDELEAEREKMAVAQAKRQAATVGNARRY